MSRPIPSATKTYHHTVYPSISPTNPSLSATGKNVAITGSGSGMGVQMTLSFAAAGASTILLMGRRRHALETTKSSINAAFPSVSVLATPTDITKKDQVETSFAAFEKHCKGGKIDVLISNASVMGPAEALGAIDPDVFLHNVDESLRGATYLADAFLQYSTPDAVIVNVSSANAFMFVVPAFLSYAVAKMAVARMWDTVALTHPELFLYHLQPGMVRGTGMNGTFLEYVSKGEGGVTVDGEKKDNEDMLDDGE